MATTKAYRQNCRSAVRCDLLDHRFASRHISGVFDLALSVPAVLSAESRPVYEVTNLLARVPKTMTGIIVALFHTCMIQIYYDRLI